MWTRRRFNLQWITSHRTQSIGVASQQNQWKYTFVDLVREWNLCSPRRSGISAFAFIPRKDERSKYYTISCHEQFQMFLIWKCGGKKNKVLLIETKQHKTLMQNKRFQYVDLKFKLLFQVSTSNDTEWQLETEIIRFWNITMKKHVFLLKISL